MFLDDILELLFNCWYLKYNNLLAKSSIFDMYFYGEIILYVQVLMCHFVYKFLFRHLDGKKYILPFRSREKKKNLHRRFLYIWIDFIFDFHFEN